MYMTKILTHQFDACSNGLKGIGIQGQNHV